MVKKENPSREGISFVENDLVFAKVRGYAPWPSRILQALSNTRFNVFFYGTHQSSVVKKVDLEPYNEASKAKYRNVKAKNYPESLKEMEETPEIYLSFWAEDKNEASNSARLSKRKLVEENVLENEKPSKKPMKESNQVEPKEDKPSKVSKKQKTEVKKDDTQSKTIGEAEAKASDLSASVTIPAEPGANDIVVTESKANENSLTKERVSRRLLKNVTPPIPEVTLKTSKPQKIIEKENIESSIKIKAESESHVPKGILETKNPDGIEQDEKPRPERRAKRGTKEEISAIKKEPPSEEEVDTGVKQEMDEKKVTKTKRTPKNHDDNCEVQVDSIKKHANQRKTGIKPESKNPPASEKTESAKSSSEETRPKKVLDLKMPIPVKDFLSSDNCEMLSQMKVKVLKKEYELLNLEFELKKYLCIDNMDLVRAVSVMKKFKSFQINKLQVLKNPFLEDTMRVLVDFYETEKDSKDKKKVKMAKEIRESAELVHKKIRKIFDMEDPETFRVEFPKVIDNFDTFSSELPEDVRLLTELPDKFQ